MNRRFTAFESALINELANIANLLVDRLHGPDYRNLSTAALREVVETTIRVAAARKRLGRLRQLRRPGRHDLKLESPELARLHLDGVDLDSPFGCDDVKG